MSADRLAQLQALLAEEPGDVFLRYALALELRRLEQMNEAVAQLEALLTDHPEHVPGHHQLALMYAAQGRTAEAVEAARAGALQALVQGDRKARAELLELVAGLTDEDDEP